LPSTKNFSGVLRAKAEEKHTTDTKRATTANDLAMVINVLLILLVIDVAPLEMREEGCYGILL